eukprot:2553818-Prymnesium_polylepis.1
MPRPPSPPPPTAVPPPPVHPLGLATVVASCTAGLVRRGGRARSPCLGYGLLRGRHRPDLPGRPNLGNSPRRCAWHVERGTVPYSKSSHGHEAVTNVFKVRRRQRSRPARCVRPTSRLLPLGGDTVG